MNLPMKHNPRNIAMPSMKMEGKNGGHQLVEKVFFWG
jgi:hypothetical protein